MAIYTWKKVEYIKNKVEYLRKKFPKVKVNFYERGEEKDYSNCEYIIGVDMNLKELETCQSLKKILVPYTGLNQFPVEEIEKRGIEIDGTHAKAKYVAERGLSLLLGIMGRVCEYDDGMRKGIWGPRSGMKNHWESLHNKKIGILGTGHIGKEFMKLVSPFTTNFSALDRGKKHEGIQKYYPTLDELAEGVDIIFMSLPLTKDTEGLVGKETLEKLKGYIINVGRGRTIDEEALYNSLKAGKLKGAGVEVWYDYPKDKTTGMPSKYPFEELENIVMSPHVATSNIEDRWAYFDDTFEKLEELIKEKLK